MGVCGKARRVGDRQFLSCAHTLPEMARHMPSQVSSLLCYGTEKLMFGDMHGMHWGPQCPCALDGR